MKMKKFDLITKLFHFHRILKNGDREGARANPMNPIYLSLLPTPHPTPQCPTPPPPPPTTPTLYFVFCVIEEGQHCSIKNGVHISDNSIFSYLNLHITNAPVVYVWRQIQQINTDITFFFSCNTLSAAGQNIFYFLSCCF